MCGLPQYRFIEALLTGLFRWITNRITDILGTEDDVVIELCFNLIEASRYVSPFLPTQTVESIS